MAHWFPYGKQFDFVGKFKPMMTLSALLVGVSLFGIFVFPGLNYGTDFSGGTEAQVELSREVAPAQLRAALAKGGFGTAETVKLTDPNRPHFFSVRLGQVSTLSAGQIGKVRTALEAKAAGSVRKLDFSEGADRFYVRLSKELSLAEIEAAIRQAGVAPQQLQPFGRPADRTYECIVVSLDRQLRERLDAALGAGTVKDVPTIESVGAKAGAQLRNDGIKATIYSLLLILVYVALRFDFRFAPGGVVALLHDCIIAAGAVAFTRREFNLVTVAALMTIAGYSINDTIIIFDRVREHMGRTKERKLETIFNAALSETLARTILTTFATQLSVLALLVFGTGLIRDFAFTLTIGFVVGTYSSLFIASPLVLWLDRTTGQGQSKRGKPAAARRGGLPSGKKPTPAGSEA